MEQEAAVFDDLSPVRDDIYWLNRLINFDIDFVPIKNGFVPLNIKVIFLVPNYSFDELFAREQIISVLR